MKAIDSLFSFEGKVIIITGAAGAIGSAAGKLFASLGANVVISDLNEEGAKKVAAEITKETGKEALGIRTNATVESELEELVHVTVKKFGKISGLINNVGWGANTPIWGSDTDKMVKSYLLNTVGAYNLTKNYVCLTLRKNPMPVLYFPVQW